MDTKDNLWSSPVLDIIAVNVLGEVEYAADLLWEMHGFDCNCLEVGYKESASSHLVVLLSQGEVIAVDSLESISCYDAEKHKVYTLNSYRDALVFKRNDIADANCVGCVSSNLDIPFFLSSSRIVYFYHPSKLWAKSIFGVNDVTTPQKPQKEQTAQEKAVSGKDHRVVFFENYLNGMAVQYRSIGSEQWHNITDKSVNYLARSNFEYREKPEKVEINGLLLTKEQAIAYIEKIY